MQLIDERANRYIADYNEARRGPHYNRVAHEIYDERIRLVDPLSPAFRLSLIKGLKGFDMSRTMSADFRSRLGDCMTALQSTGVSALIGCHLSTIDLDTHATLIEKAYQCLAAPGNLHEKKQSHVAATKILHWLNPELFIIMDRNVACAFQNRFAVRFLDTTQPGYSSRKYLACLRHAQNEIGTFGLERFRALELGSPEARIFDKIAFAAGVECRRAS